MKPQFKPEQIYLDLSELSKEQQRKVIEISNVSVDYLKYAPFLIYLNDKFITSNGGYIHRENLTELTYSQFLDMMGESEEVLQVENNGWIKILSETDLPKEVDQYWFASHNNKIEIRFYNPNWINDRVQFRHRYTHYQPIVKPLPPKF